MYYGAYKDIRNSAWKCLIDFNIGSLPVDILKITRFAKIRVIRNSSVNELMPGENGKSYFDGSKWIIIYNDENPTSVSRFTIAHELGHIFLGHELKRVKYLNANEFRSKPRAEQEADMFAERLLCPACVLWELNLYSPEDIADICRVPQSVANVRASRMQELYKRNKFLSSPLEKELYINFFEYLSGQKGDGYTNVDNNVSMKGGAAPL
ncbi:MAG: ImmA/IrrE family metallo-endopeptidase [Clostridia bacterium]|nr:ImmA/IrrE family metallo-endopeptidase [Clostridia bacterium]